MADPIRIFIGSGEASLLERKVLIYSLKKHTRRELDISVFNGTHDSLEREGTQPIALQTPLEIKYRNFTEFSNYRFFIPGLCQNVGRALWIDSDTVCLSDIGELYDADMSQVDVLAKPDAYDYTASDRWGLSVSLYDCSRCNWNVPRYFDDVRAGLYSYTDLHQFSPRFREVHPVKISALDPNWNVFDRYDGDTKLIHYTNLLTQPWKYRGHRFGDLWFQYFTEARREGFITPEDVETTLVRRYARQDLLEGNEWTISSLVKTYSNHAARMVLNRFRRWQN